MHYVQGIVILYWHYGSIMHMELTIQLLSKERHSKEQMGKLEYCTKIKGLSQQSY